MGPRRSLLFVPGADSRLLEAAARSEADCLILDLEDTVTPDRKPAARTLVAEFLRWPPRPGLERAVRVNPVSTPWFAADVAAVAAAADALVLPKIESPDEVAAVGSRLRPAEREAGRSPGSVGVLALIETPRGLLAAASIAAADSRVGALLLGHVDLSRALGIREAGATEAMILHARCQLVLAAKAAGRQAIDTVFMDLGDARGFAAEARQGLRLGFTGKLLIDERQVALLHEAYRPSEDEVAYARRLVAAWEAAAAEGTGLIVFEGRAIDLPVVEAERTILARAGATRAAPAGGHPPGARSP